MVKYICKECKKECKVLYGNKCEKCEFKNEKKDTKTMRQSTKSNS